MKVRVHANKNLKKMNFFIFEFFQKQIAPLYRSQGSWLIITAFCSSVVSISREN